MNKLQSCSTGQLSYLFSDYILQQLPRQLSLGLGNQLCAQFDLFVGHLRNQTRYQLRIALNE